jgi:hypothetical protein
VLYHSFYGYVLFARYFRTVAAGVTMLFIVSVSFALHRLILSVQHKRVSHPVEVEHTETATSRSAVQKTFRNMLSGFAIEQCSLSVRTNSSAWHMRARWRSTL